VTTLEAAAPHKVSPTDPHRLIAVAGLAILLSELVFLGGAWFQGFFITDRAGHGIANDFVNVWAAGRLALDGHPAAAYDWAIHRQMQEAAVGHAFDGEYRWHYPPPFLFAAALVAMLPFVPAGLAWLAATGAAYVAAIRTTDLPAPGADWLAII